MAELGCESSATWISSGHLSSHIGLMMVGSRAPRAPRDYLQEKGGQFCSVLAPNPLTSGALLSSLLHISSKSGSLCLKGGTARSMFADCGTASWYHRSCRMTCWYDLSSVFLFSYQFEVEWYQVVLTLPKHKLFHLLRYSNDWSTKDWILALYENTVPTCFSERNFMCFLHAPNSNHWSKNNMGSY